MKDKILQYKKQIILVSLVIVAGITVLCLYQYKKNPVYVMEEGISESLENYSSLNEADIKVLKREINDVVENKLEEVNTKELTPENLKELMLAIKDELNYATYNIPEEEINRMVNEIIKKVLELKISDDREKLEAYQKQIDVLTKQLIELENRINNIPYTADDIKKIAQQYDWTESEIINIISKHSKESNKMLQTLANSLDMSTEELNKIIAENREYTDALYIKLAESFEVDAEELKTLIEEANNNTNLDITYITEKLGITEEKLYAEIANCRTMSSAEAKAVADALAVDISNIENIINENQEKIEAEMQNLEMEMKSNISELEAATASKEALEKAQVSIQNALDAEESAREEAVQQAIDDLNNAISLSGENASTELLEVKQKLEDALASGMDETNSALEETKVVLEADISVLDNKMQELSNSITSVQMGLNETNETVSLIEKEMENMENEVQNNISELEATTTSKIEESVESMKKDVLFYEYDDSSNTLKLFEYKEGFD